MKVASPLESERQVGRQASGPRRFPRPDGLARPTCLRHGIDRLAQAHHAGAGGATVALSTTRASLSQVDYPSRVGILRATIPSCRRRTERRCPGRQAFREPPCYLEKHIEEEAGEPSGCSKTSRSGRRDRRYHACPVSERRAPHRAAVLRVHRAPYRFSASSLALERERRRGSSSTAHRAHWTNATAFRTLIAHADRTRSPGRLDELLDRHDSRASSGCS
jgi:hypothetical protein